MLVESGEARLLAGGFEVDLADERQPPLLRRVLAALPPAPSTLRAALTARLSLASAWSASIEARVELAEEALAMSEAVGDPAVRASAVAAYCDAVAGPDFIDERRKAAAEMLELAKAAAHVRLLRLARRLLVVALLERGRGRPRDQRLRPACRRTLCTAERVARPDLAEEATGITFDLVEGPLARP